MMKRDSITLVSAPDSPAKAKPAATVILVRETAKGLETYLMRRRGKNGAFAGAFVFPGGLLEDSDADPALSARVAAPENRSGVDSALFVTAIRETFEESGVLFADRAGEDALERRRDVASGRMSIAELAASYDLSLRACDLLPFGRWVTPLAEPRRFDASFFAARLPEGQDPQPDGNELSEGLWIRPVEAMERQAAGILPLFPPTLYTLWEIARFGSFGDLALAAAERDLGPVLPQPFYTDEAMGVLLPHDPEYPVAGFRRSSMPGRPSRVVARSGRWTLQ